MSISVPPPHPDQVQIFYRRVDVQAASHWTVSFSRTLPAQIWFVVKDEVLAAALAYAIVFIHIDQPRSRAAAAWNEHPTIFARDLVAAGDRYLQLLIIV